MTTKPAVGNANYRAWIDKIFERAARGDSTLSPYALKLATEARGYFERRGPVNDDDYYARLRKVDIEL
jgi:hypothetical protein